MMGHQEIQTTSNENRKFALMCGKCNDKAWLESAAGETWNSAGKTSTAHESGALGIILNVNCSVKLGSEYCHASDFIRVLNDIKLLFFFNEPWVSFFFR